MNEGSHLNIGRVELQDFRSYPSLVMEPSRGLTVVVGPNASGKTNLLEAIRLATTGTSFRRPRWEDLIRKGAEKARVSMSAIAEGGSVLDTEVVLDSSGRTLTMNGKKVRRRADLASKLPSVVFTPDDLRIVKGPAEDRRDAVDDVGESLSSAYGALRKEYGRILRQRNALLKERQGERSLLDPWTERIAVVGGRLASHRVSLLQKMAAQAELVYSEIASGESLTIRYQDSYGMAVEGWPEEANTERVAAAIKATLERRHGEEERRGSTIAGPHRDDIVFEIHGTDARTHASQGQQRTIALSWKIAELRVVQSVTGRQPVLLLDDVMSELDARRRSALTRYAREGLQTFITATTLDYFDPALLEGALIVRTDAGRHT